MSSLPARGIILLAAVVLLGACSSKRPLMPTPDIYSLGIEQPFAETLPEELKTADMNIMYATDRAPNSREDGRLDYSMGRAPTLEFGEAVVNIGGDTTWEKLVADARAGARSPALNLGIKSVTERARGPRDSVVYYGPNGNLKVTGEGARQLDVMTSTVHGMLRERLATSPRKEILLYVHGVKTSFDEALYTTAELWHYLGREFVPMAYSSPAGKRGLVRGYNYDRESSEFTVFHFKRFLEWAATLPEVEGIHIIAHSRGTDIVLTAIRELVIAARAAGENPRERFKLRNVVIAAPDINLEVSLQRTEREGTRWAAERWTTYTSSRDKAIGSSEWLSGGGRYGKAGNDNIDDFARIWVENFSDVEAVSRDTVIQYQGRSGGAFGHLYYRSNPAC
jgi:esterase/lipase superfamily enzyme